MGFSSKVRNALAFLRGHGVELTKDTWEREYEHGDWKYLHSLEQLPRYSTLVGYIHQLKPRGAVLDVGCGDGLLQRLLAPYGYERYLGLDLSDAAIAAAGEATDERTHFQQCDAATWNPAELFDIIVFNEVLYYFHDPLVVARRYERALRPNGVFLVSIYWQMGNTRSFWRQLARRYACLHRAHIVSGERYRWEIRILRPPDAPGPVETDA